jgi:hypothetical protein
MVARSEAGLVALRSGRRQGGLTGVDFVHGSDFHVGHWPHSPLPTMGYASAGHLIGVKNRIRPVALRGGPHFGSAITGDDKAEGS